MCGQNTYDRMELQQFEMKKENINDQFCPPDCDNCINIDDNNEECKQSLNSLFDHQTEFCPCPKKCCMPFCSPFSKRKYIQPPRQESFKPVICYEKPSLPFPNETIYKKSFECIDPNTAACCRLPIIRPKEFLKSPNSAFEKNTVTKLSFPTYCIIERTKPIIPKSSSLLSSGPIQEMTTQKHDYISKFQYRRLKILPKDNIKKLDGCIEKETTQRLSFMPNCKVERRKSFKPSVIYKKSDVPMEFQTTQKLSFMPITLSSREEFSWAKKAKYQPSSIEFAKDTITKLSYMAPGYFVDDEQCK